MKRGSIIFIVGLSICVCAGCSLVKQVSMKGSHENLLTSAPEINLVDTLSGEINAFKVQPGNYEWSYLNGKEMTSLVACGSHPLDSVNIKKETLTVPIYEGVDYVPYTVSVEVEPDELTVKEWDLSAIGNGEEKALSTVTYEVVEGIELKPNRLYEINILWDEKNLEINGFYGSASYVVMTENDN